MTEIILCILFGYLLIGLEAIVPGGILGILGFCSIVGAAYCAHLEVGGIFAPSITFLTAGLGAVALVFLEFRWLSESKLGKNLFMGASTGGVSNAALAESELIGLNGKIITDLHPEGIVSVDGKSYDAVSEDGFLSKGTKIKVSGKDDFRIRVQKL